MGMIVRQLQITPNVFGRSGDITKQGGKGSTRFTMGQGLAVPIRKITKAGVGKDGIAKPKTGFTPKFGVIYPHRGKGMPRPVVKGMDTEGRILKKAKKYWMWIVAAIIGYFLLKRK